MKLLALTFLSASIVLFADEPKKVEPPKTASLSGEEAYHFKYLASRIQVLNDEYVKLQGEFNSLKAEQEAMAKSACSKVGVEDTSKCSIDTDKKIVSKIEATPAPVPVKP